MAVGQNPVPLVNIKIGGKWMWMPHQNGSHRLCPMATLANGNSSIAHQTRKAGITRRSLSRLGEPISESCRLQTSQPNGNPAQHGFSKRRRLRKPIPTGPTHFRLDCHLLFTPTMIVFSSSNTYAGIPVNFPGLICKPREISGPQKPLL